MATLTTLVRAVFLLHSIISIAAGSHHRFVIELPKPDSDADGHPAEMTIQGRSAFQSERSDRSLFTDMLRPLVENINKIANNLPTVTVDNGNLVVDVPNNRPSFFPPPAASVDGNENISPKKTCTAENGKTGACVEFGRCPAQSSWNLPTFLRSLCYHRRGLGVCCLQHVPDTHTDDSTTTTEPPSNLIVETDKIISQSTTPKIETTTTPTRTQPTTTQPIKPVSSTYKDQQCGRVLRGEDRIVGGDVSRPGAWPWMAAIYLRGVDGLEFWCGGSLISNRYVLTAAKCTQDNKNHRFRPSQFAVKFGEFRLTGADPGESEVHRVTNIRIHPQFSYRDSSNDLAIFQLDRPVDLSDFIQPICMPSKSEIWHSFQGDMATVIGWGSTFYGGGDSPELRYVHLPVWSNDDCARSYYFHNITDAVLCAGVADGGKDTCTGDSGGPLMLHLNNRWVQIGIVSFGIKCAEPGFPGVYTRITHYLDWIDANTPEVNDARPPGALTRVTTEASTTTKATTTATTLGTSPPATAPPVERKCGQRAPSVFRIVGGSQAPIGTWPWMAAIFLRGPRGEEFWCGGSLINEQYILTAAHCTLNPDRTKRFLPSQYLVKLGEFNLKEHDDGETEVLRVSAVKTHRGFPSRGFFNDIALLKLERPVEFTETIRPICLPTGSDKSKTFVDSMAIVAGWGLTSTRGQQSQFLMNVALPVWKNEDCGRAYSTKFTDMFICAGYAAGGKDACQGDSGGPLMVKENDTWMQIGIVSFGKECALPGVPGVYTRATHFLDWIAENAV